MCGKDKWKLAGMFWCVGREAVNLSQCFPQPPPPGPFGMLQTLLCSRSTFCAASVVLLWILCSGQCDPDAEGCGPALPSTGSHCSTFLWLGSLTGLVPCGQRADCLLSWYFLSPSTSGEASNLPFT